MKSSARANSSRLAKFFRPRVEELRSRVAPALLVGADLAPVDDTAGAVVEQGNVSDVSVVNADEADVAVVDDLPTTTDDVLQEGDPLVMDDVVSVEDVVPVENVVPVEGEVPGWEMWSSVGSEPLVVEDAVPVDGEVLGDPVTVEESAVGADGEAVGEVHTRDLVVDAEGGGEAVDPRIFQSFAGGLGGGEFEPGGAELQRGGGEPAVAVEAPANPPEANFAGVRDFGDVRGGGLVSVFAGPLPVAEVDGHLAVAEATFGNVEVSNIAFTSIQPASTPVANHFGLPALVDSTATVAVHPPVETSIQKDLAVEPETQVAVTTSVSPLSKVVLDVGSLVDIANAQVAEAELATE